jgi:phenylacetate-CoA ligase
MGIHTALVANILFPLQEKLKKHDTVAIRQAMDDSQWWPAEKLEALRSGTTARLAHQSRQTRPVLS